MRKNRSHHKPVTKTFYRNNLYLVIINHAPNLHATKRQDYPTTLLAQADGDPTSTTMRI